ncbi:hypothetical protein ACHAW5_005564 [Stephanodiscus triporus]|uniref:Uncharacterized protein n=1 Tax=Stephanodiscus triporus TaxID=2934178 RepID=A0ABD3P5Z5_9STRA
MEASVRALVKRHPLNGRGGPGPLVIVIIVVDDDFRRGGCLRRVSLAAIADPNAIDRSSSSSSSSSSRLGVSIGLGPEGDVSSSATAGVDNDESESTKKFGKSFDPNFEPYRTSRMSQSDRDANAWFTSLLKSPGGDAYLGAVSAEHKRRLITKRYGEDEDCTPYVSRHQPKSPLYPAYGLETYGLPVLRREAKAWRHFDMNGLVSLDYSTRPVGIGTNYVVANEVEGEELIALLRGKGAWLDNDACCARLVYVDRRFCPGVSKQTDLVKNLDPSHFESGSISNKILEYLSRLPDGFTDRLAADVPDTAKGALTSYKRLSGPDHSVGKATLQFAINAQQGTAAFVALMNSIKAGCAAYVESVVAGALPVLVVNAQTPSGGKGGDDDDDVWHWG